jgi:hypothetical protein
MSTADISKLDTKVASAVNGFAQEQRDGAMTPAETRLSRPLGATDVPHKKVEKICCIGAGYVGMFLHISRRMKPFRNEICKM